LVSDTLNLAARATVRSACYRLRVPDPTPRPPGTKRLYRPTGQAERDLVAASGWRAWPLRLPDQPIFYPVLNEWYATEITRKWNVPHGGVGYVMAFDVRDEFLAEFPVRRVGGRDVVELWIPAERVDELNANIVGGIREIARYDNETDSSATNR
jgi:hypothetical protein